jgi:2',3'-cyclic-nucleotide 2'-phosphodiesterase
MNFLFLGDIVGRSGRDIVLSELPKVKVKEEIDFVIVNGENAAGGYGITKKICDELFSVGVDVITSGNHIWDQKETADFISAEKRLLRPLNFMEGTPGSGCEIYPLKNNKRVAVINIMGNVYMKKADDVFNCISLKLQSLKLSKDVDFIIVDIHAEITSEKMAMGHYLDGQVTLVVGTHSHVPTYDFRILNHGTAYQTDAGMCGDYDSVIGMNKDAALKKFLKQPNLERLSPALGKGTLSGIKVIADEKTGLAKDIKPITIGAHFNQRSF